MLGPIDLELGRLKNPQKSLIPIGSCWDLHTENGTLKLAWAAVGADKIQINLTTSYNGTLTPGWLAVGWSADGTMANGDYVLAYTDSTSNLCVRTLVNADDGSIPTETSAFNVSSGASFSVTGKNMMLSFTRDLAGGMSPITAAGNYVLTAAASSSKVPPSCTADLSFNNKHDMHNYVTHGLKFGLVSTENVLEVV